ncbi:ATP-binding protein [Nocardioides sp. LS1]|uniref:sensor histidine kinase n=1 Tax=Nocardioides sp. LS1 TaxID=1027620 RepID=UPI000F620B71|nr:ATP-binding protein [Nocardioides sp. LS1]GCD88322.1 hypothetical protein NLS1_03280 [Nocardioides sp. LS1]
MSNGRPVARLVAPIVVRFVVSVGLMAVIAVTGVVLSTAAVGHLSDDLQPAVAANQDVLQDLTDVKGAVGDWARSGQPTYKDAYQQALSRLPGDMRAVARFAADDPELAALVAEQERAAQVWLDRYAEPRISDPGGPDTYQPKRFRIGARTFADFRAAQQLTSEAFDRRVERADTDASRLLKGTVISVVVVAVVAWWVTSLARKRLLEELSTPLLDLEGVVHALARNEPGARAENAGPREVRAVAAALNDLADAQARARAVEHRIQDELRILDTARDDFVSNVSHELRTPLTTISGYLEMVAEEFEGSLAPRHERMLAATRRNVSRLKLLIDDLLTLSRAEARATDLEAVDITGLTRDAVTDVRITAANRGIKIVVTAPEEALLVLADRAMLHRAFLNVLSNAVKFSRDGGQVEVELWRDDDRLAVQIRDHGIGIPASEVERLGTRFFRASNAVTNEIAGTGLGLRIVQTIVDKHAGDVLIESQEGRGTTVVVHLPLQSETAVTPPTVAPEPRVGADPEMTSH